MFLKWIDLINDKLGQFCGWFVLIITGIITFEVVARYIFDAPTTWANEISSQVFALYTLALAGTTYLYGGHINVDIILNRLSIRRRAIMDLVSYVFVLLYCGMLVYYGGIEGIRSLSLQEHTISVGGPPVYHVKMAIPIAALLVILQATAKFLRGLYFVRTGRQVS